MPQRNKGHEGIEEEGCLAAWWRWFDTKGAEDTEGAKRGRDAVVWGEPTTFCVRNANSGLTPAGLAAF